jgi:hypothetical protein
VETGAKYRCIGAIAPLRLFIDMVGIIKFLRTHPMGVVLVTSLLTLGAMVAVIVCYPHWVDRQLIDKLASKDFMVRSQAIVEAASRAKTRKPMEHELVAALDAEDDTLFFAAVTALNAADRFKTPDRDPLHIDRAIAVEFATAPNPNTQVWLLSQIINTRHDNRYIRRALKSAAASKDVGVRTGSALLAALLKDDAVLGKLLTDEEGAVRAAAALDAGLAGRKALGEAIVERLEDADAKVAGNAAVGLAYMDPTEYSPKLCTLLTETQDATLRRKLCAVMMILNNDIAREAVGKLLASRRGKHLPASMTLLAAGKLAADGAADDIRTVLSMALKDRNTNRRVVHAAIVAADELKLPVRRELYKICRKYWNPDWRAELMFAAAACLLGRQASDDTGQAADAPTRRECETLLLGAAYYAHRQPTTGPATGVQTTPIASAAAATAFWLLNPSARTTVQLKKVTPDSGIVEFTGRSVTGARVVMDVAEYSILAGDYIAWYVAESGRPEAFKLGLRMLPPIDAPLGQHVYNENLRGAGAMLLAFSARTDDQKQIAIQRIKERLEPGADHSGEDDPVLAGRYRCALLILGVRDYVKIVSDQRNDSGHAVPAAFTALCFAGEIETLDYLLHNTHIPLQDIAAYMIYDGLDRVLAACAPELPRVDTSAPSEIQLWQAHIVRDYYVLHRGAFFLGAKR